MKKLSKEEKAIYRKENGARFLRKLKQNAVVYALKGIGLAFGISWIIFLVINQLIIGQEVKVILSLVGSSGLGLVVGIIAYRSIKMKLQAKIIASEVVKELDAVGKNPIPGLIARLIYILSPVIILSLLSFGIASYVGSFAVVMLQLLVAGLGVIPYAIGEYIDWEFRKQTNYTDRIQNNEQIVDAVTEKITGFMSQ